MQDRAKHEVLGGLNRLTVDLLAQVLQHLPQDVLMRDCTCVSTTWHAATLASIQILKTDRLRVTQAAAAPAWLSKYGPAASIAELDLQLLPGPSSGSGSDNGSSSIDSITRALCEALPAVRGLKSLRLAGLWLQEPVLATVASLRDLQDLSLKCGRITTIPALPVSLTALKLAERSISHWRPYSFNPENPPAPPRTAQFTALRGLTNLQHLSVSCSYVQVSFEDVAQLHKLRTCVISIDSMPAPNRDTQHLPIGLAGFSNLRDLQHLDLAEWVCREGYRTPPRLTAADCAALTASSQLTLLDLSKWQLEPELCSAAFPPKLLLPKLQELRIGPCFVQNPAATAAVVSAAPSLISLKVSGADSSEYDYVEHYEQEMVSRVRVQGLERLTSLQGIVLDDVRVTDTGIWGLLVQMTQLTGLEIKSVSIPCLPGIPQLTALLELKKLEVTVEYQQDDGYAEGSVSLSGGYAYLALHLPAKVVQCAADLLRMAIHEEVLAAAALLLEAAPAACAAALQAFTNVENEFMAITTRTETVNVAAADAILRQLDQLEALCEQDVEYIQEALPAAAAAGTSVGMQGQQQQRGSADAADAARLALRLLHGPKQQAVSNHPLLLRCVDVCASDVLEIEKAVSLLVQLGSLVSSAGQNLMAAVQELRGYMKQLQGDEGDEAGIRELSEFGRDLASWMRQDE